MGKEEEAFITTYREAVQLSRYREFSKKAWNSAMPRPSPDSLIDRVDADDIPIGTVRRRDALERGANFRTVHVFVFSAGELLLQELAPTRERHPCRWGSSVAAYLFAGEDYEEAARRRLSDELGLRTPLALMGKTEMRDDDSRKFVELFVSQSDNATIREPEHIGALRYWRRGDLDDAIQDSPTRFTPTFLHLYEQFRNSLIPQLLR